MSPIKRRILGWVWWYWAHRRSSLATVKQLGEDVGRTENPVFYQLGQLERQGWVIRDPIGVRPGPRFAGWDRKRMVPLEVIE